MGIIREMREVCQQRRPNAKGKMIGGAPVTERYAQKIKADSYASDAGSAVSKAKNLLGVS